MSSISKSKSTRARTMRISAYARFRPMHPRGPMLNGCEASRRSSAYRTSPSQRSGTKESGSRKLRGEWQAAHAGTATLWAGFEVSVALFKVCDCGTIQALGIGKIGLLLSRDLCHISSTQWRDCSTENTYHAARHKMAAHDFPLTGWDKPYQCTCDWWHDSERLV